MKRRDALLTAASLLAAVRAPAQSASLPGAASAVAPGAEVDWPRLTLVDGSTLAPSAWQGVGAVVVLWATSCPYCKRHNVHIDKLHRASLKLPLRVIGVALDSDAALVAATAAAQGYSFPLAYNGALARPHFTPRRVIPMTCVIDRRGVLRQAIPGEMFEEDVMGLAAVALQG
jgi:peroxiredoxin